jgi:DNA-binding NarL/FixJ family response regulator
MARSFMQRYASDPLFEADAAVRPLIIADDSIVRADLVAKMAGALAMGVGSEGLERTLATTAATVLIHDFGSRLELSIVDVLVRSRLPVIALVPSSEHASELLRRGAAAVLDQDVDAATLHSACAAVCRGLSVAPRGLLVVTQHGVPHRDRSVLTRREHEVLALMAQGLSNPLIARRLGISSHTAKFHAGAIMHKLDADTRTEAVVRAMQHGWLDQADDPTKNRTA